MTARVVLLSTNLARGGAEAQVAQLALGLRRMGWETSVITLLPPTAFTGELAGAGARVFSLDMRPGVWNPLGYVRLLRLLRELRPQILHAHMFHANLLARLVRLVCPVPVVISTLHSAAESGRASRSVRGRDRLYRFTDPLADTTVAVASAVALRHASARAVPRRKLRVIPNGVDTDVFRPNPARRALVRQSLGLGPEFSWLAVGRLMWKKGYETLLEAFQRCGEGVLLIAGSGPQKDELGRLATENVRFLGQRDDVADLMAACDGFVQSSLVEGLPVALLEAAASGLVSVATNAGGASEVGIKYLVPPGDTASLAAAMKRVMHLSAEERAQIGLETRARIVAEFDTRLTLAKWESLYREMLAPWM